MRARRSGYPVKVCLDVAFDGHHDTASLVNGSGAFASLAEPVRARVRRWRRWRAAIGALAPILTVVFGVAWVFLAKGGSAHAERVVSASAFALLLLPFAGGLFAYLVLAAREGGVVPRSRLTWRQWMARRRQPLVIRDVAVNWLRGAGPTGTTEPRRQHWLATAGHGALDLLLVGFVLVMALLAYVSISASMTVVKYRRPAEQWQNLRRPWASVSWHAVDSAVRSLGVAPTPTQPDTDATASVARLLFAGGVGSGVAARLWRVPTSTPVVSVPGYSDLDVRPYFAVMRGGADTIPQRLRREIDSNLTSSGYLAWKRFARAAPPPPLWYYGPEFGGLGAGTVVQHFADLNFSTLFGLTATSVMEIVVATQSGDRSRALGVAGELLAAGLTLGRQPVSGASIAAFRAIRYGVLATRELARRRDDLALASRADSVLGMLSRAPVLGSESMFRSFLRGEGVDEAAVLMGPMMLVSDPSSQSAGAALAGRIPREQTPLDPVERWQLIAAVVPAFCISAREVLVGIDPQRGAALESALGRQRDLPRTDEWIRANLRWYEQLRDDPGSDGVRTEGESSTRLEIPWPLKPLGWVGLSRMRDRVAFCQQWVWY